MKRLADDIEKILFTRQQPAERVREPGPEAECEAREELKIFSKSFDKKKEVIYAHFLFNCLYHGDCPGHFRKRG